MVVPTMVGYACSKFACEAFSDGLRRELQAFGVKVAVVEPVVMKTGIVRFVESFKHYWNSEPPTSPTNTTQYSSHSLSSVRTNPTNEERVRRRCVL